MTDAAPDHVTVATSSLEIGYEVRGRPGGTPVLLLHGFPYDVRSYDQVSAALVPEGFRIVAPYLRGFGPTRLREAGAVRSGDQATLAKDILELSDALGLVSPVLVGFDWGGRAACAAAALWPERFRALVAIGGYSIYNIATSALPAPPHVERVLWYQYYLHSERGRAGLAKDRRALASMLWSEWSPHWAYDEETFDRTARSFENPNFVDIVLHSYRHRFGLVAGDPSSAELEARLQHSPPIDIPAIVLYGGSGPLPPPVSAGNSSFRQLRAVRTIDHSGHKLPAEAPDAVVAAILELCRATESKPSV